jgi:excisionase family DNA binding protein
MFNEAEREVLAVGLEDAAKMLGICKTTVERLRDSGKLRCLRIGRHWKVRVAELHAFLRRQETAV